MNLVARVDMEIGKMTFRNLDQGEALVGFVERRGPIWLAVVGQDDPATTWEKTFECWHRAGAAVCIELARRHDTEVRAAS